MSERIKFEGHQIESTESPHYPEVGLLARVWMGMLPSQLNTKTLNGMPPDLVPQAVTLSEAK